MPSYWINLSLPDYHISFLWKKKLYRSSPIVQKAELTLNTSEDSSSSHLSTICRNSGNGTSQVCKVKRVWERQHNCSLYALYSCIKKNRSLSEQLPTDQNFLLKSLTLHFFQSTTEILERYENGALIRYPNYTPQDQGFVLSKQVSTSHEPLQFMIIFIQEKKVIRTTFH